MCRCKRPTRAQSATPKPAPRSHTPRTHASKWRPNQGRKGYDSPGAHKSNQIWSPLFRHKRNNLCQDQARRTSTSRPYHPLYPKIGPSPTPIMAFPHRSHPGTRQKPCLIYDFSWSGLNKAVTQVAHKEEMRFGKALYREIDCILAAPPKLGPALINKLDLADAYMCIWVCLRDIPSVAFLVPKATPNDFPSVG